MNGSEYELGPGTNRKAASAHLRRNASALLQYADGELTSNEQQSMAAHFVTCPECRAFHKQAQHLNAALERALTPPLLSPAFTPGLWEKIDAQCSSDPASAYREQKRNIEREFEAYSNRLRKEMFRLPNLLDALGCAVAFAMAAYLLVALTTGLATKWLPRLEEHGILVLSCTAAMSFLMIGFGIALKRPVAR